MSWMLQYHWQNGVGSSSFEIVRKQRSETMKTIRNTNERFGDPIEFSGETLDEAVAIAASWNEECDK